MKPWISYLTAALKHTALGALIATLAGCQNMMTVRVELLKPANEKAAQPADAQASVNTAQHYASEVAETQAGISQMRSRVDEALSGLEKAGYSREVIEKGPQFTSIVRLRDALAGFQAAIAPHVGRLSSGTNGLTPITMNDLRELRALQLRLSGTLRLYVDPLERLLAHLSDFTDAGAKQVTVTVQRLLQDVRSQHASLGFGGFRVVGAYRINAADPIYRDVTDSGKYRPSGVFSSASAAVNGDSTVVFVQESPTQIRFFEMDNDPEQLIRNVLYLTDKVLQAVVKYAGF